jgi:hypothetical protein
VSYLNYGEDVEGISYRVLNEREVRAGTGIVLFLAIIAAINGFILNRYIVIPYIVGFITFNFFISVFITPRFAPTQIIARWLVRKQTPLYFGAIRKRFAYALGFALTLTIFILSFFLLKDPSYFDTVCSLCVLCIALIYIEAVFGICIGCKLYDLSIKTGILKTPETKSNCMGDACEINP